MASESKARLVLFGVESLERKQKAEAAFTGGVKGGGSFDSLMEWISDEGVWRSKPSRVGAGREVRMSFIVSSSLLSALNSGFGVTFVK